MVIRIISHLFKLNLKNEYISKYSFIIELMSIFISLSIYHFTSLTFDSSVSGALKEYNVNYFEFIIIGELLLALPLFFLEGTFRKVKQSLMDGVWDTFNHLNINSVKTVAFLVLSALPKELIRISLTLIMSIIFFDFHIDFKSLLFALSLVIASIPIFFSFGVLFSVVLLRTGRGQSLIGYFLTIMTIGAGGFFPLSVLPKSLVNLLEYLPYTLILEKCRLYHASHSIDEVREIVWLTPWYLLIPLSFWMFNKLVSNKDTDSLILKA